MASENTPQMEDLVSIGSRISWSAILAGAAIAISFQFLLGLLAATVGASMTDRVETETLRTSAVIWLIGTACISLFVGGLITTQLTAGENKVEAVIFGIVMWATVTAIAAHGAIAGREAMMGTTGGQTSRSWEADARKAGVPADQIQQWNAKASEGREKTPQEGATASEMRWLTFGTAWLSMIAAAAGAFVGAGPTFRLAIVPRRTTAGL